MTPSTNTTQNFDVTVIGIGGMGSAALYHLAKRGSRVCGVEQFSPGHNLGSSHGDSRMIRAAYHEHPDYVPLVRRAFDHWRQLGDESGKTLLETPGVLMVGREGSKVLRGMRESAMLHGIPIEDIARDDFAQRFPGFLLPPDMTSTFEPGAGFVHVEAAVRQMTGLAVQAGATLYQEETVLSWQAKPHAIEVITDKRRINTERLVLTAGPWIKDLLGKLNLPLQLHKMMMLWFSPHNKPAPNQPGFGYDLPGGFYYGLPQVSPYGIKVGKHVAEDPIDHPDSFDRTLTQRHLEPISRFVKAYLPFLSDQVTRHASCIYTMTPDEHFIVDQYPSDPRVVFASSCSGHGFKFAPVIGEILADLCLNGSTELPADFLRLGQRFA